MPLTLVLQCAYSVVLIASALMCLEIGRKPGANAHNAAAWWLTGVAFLWHGVFDALQNAFGAIALRKGMESPTMASYLKWVPAMHHSRTFLLTALMISLGLLAFWRKQPDRRFLTIAITMLALAFVLGASLGVHEGFFVTAEHFEAVAIWDVMELLFVLAALFALLVSNRADRLLWAFLSAYAVGLALGVFWFAVLAQLQIPGSWTPAFWTLAAVRLFWGVLMFMAAAGRLRLLRKGRHVRGLLEPRTGPLPSLH